MSSWITILPPLLLASGMYLLLRGKVKKKDFEREVLRSAGEKFKNMAPEVSLRERIEILNGSRNSSIIRDAIHKKGTIIPFLLGAGGFILSMAFFESVIISAPISLICWLLPSWLERLRSYSKAEKDVLETETALSIITSSYMRGNDLVSAVEENIPYIKAPVRDLFLFFLYEYRNVTPSVQLCLENLKSRFTSKTARHWCDLAIEAQNTATVKYAMQSSLEEFRMMREVQSEYNLSLRQSMRDFRTIVLIIGAFIPGLYFYSGEWFSALTGTFPGRLSLSVLITVMLFGINKSIELQQPVTQDKEVA